MALFDFLKGIFNNEKEEVKKQEKETISIDELYSKIQKELLNSENEKLNLKNSVIDRIDQFNMEIKDKIIALEKLSIDKKKEHEKIKQIVKENLVLYIDYLNRLTGDLNSLKSLNSDTYLKKIEDIANNFNKLSRNAFEKATILIGKELGIAREITNNFFRDLNAIFDKNKDFIGKANKINKIKLFIEELNGIRQHERHIADGINDLDKKINEINNKIAEIRKDIINLKESSEYKNDLDKKEKNKLDIQKIEKEIQLLKEKMLLKDLAKHFHGDSKKSSIIKIYLADFNSAIRDDAGLEIVKIVNESHEIDLSELKGLREKFIELKEPFVTDSDRKIADFEDEIKKLGLEYFGKEAQISEDKKKKEKLVLKKEKLIEDIARNFELVFPIYGLKISLLS